VSSRKTVSGSINSLIYAMVLAVATAPETWIIKFCRYRETLTRSAVMNSLRLSSKLTWRNAKGPLTW